MENSFINIINDMVYFVGKTKRIHNHIYFAMDFTIAKDNEDESDDAGTISGFVHKEEAILLFFILDSIEFEDALTYLKTQN
jgi:hypothetical protein